MEFLQVAPPPPHCSPLPHCSLPLTNGVAAPYLELQSSLVHIAFFLRTIVVFLNFKTHPLHCLILRPPTLSYSRQLTPLELLVSRSVGILRVPSVLQMVANEAVSHHHY